MKKIKILFTLFILFSTDAFCGYAPEELRLGILRHDVTACGGHHCFERGHDVNIEALFPSPDFSFFNFLFDPRPHIGASINTCKGTHQFYLGLTWRLNFLRTFFLEATFGGEGHTSMILSVPREKTLGTHLLFRESVSLGIQLNEQFSFSFMLDYASNAQITRVNPGITSMGIRCGYKF